MAGSLVTKDSLDRALRGQGIDLFGVQGAWRLLRLRHFGGFPAPDERSVTWFGLWSFSAFLGLSIARGVRTATHWRDAGDADVSGVSCFCI